MSQLECSLNGQTITLDVDPDSTLRSLHGTEDPIVEHTTCNYGLEPAVQDIASRNGMRVSATDDTGEVRALERPDHPFFVGTLYQPQLRSTKEAPHPVFVGLLNAANQR